MSKDDSARKCPQCNRMLTEDDWWRCSECFYEFEDSSSVQEHGSVFLTEKASQATPITHDLATQRSHDKWPRRKIIGTAFWTLGALGFLMGVAGVILVGQEEGWPPGIAVAVGIGSSFLVCLFPPYQFWIHCCQYVNKSTAELVCSLQKQPLDRDTQHLIAELGKRGVEAANAAPLLVEAFKRTLDAPMQDIVDYSNLQFSVVKSLLQMGRPLDVVEAVTASSFLVDQRKGDWEGNRNSLGEILRHKCFDYLTYVGPQAKKAIPMLTKIAGDDSSAPGFVKEDAKAAIRTIEAGGPPRWQPIQ